MKHHIDEHGRLVITGVPDEDFTCIEDALGHLIANSELDWIRPEECGDLTDAPILGYRNENGEPTENRWGFMDYQIIDPLEHQRKHGETVWQPAS